MQGHRNTDIYMNFGLCSIVHIAQVKGHINSLALGSYVICEISIKSHDNRTYQMNTQRKGDNLYTQSYSTDVYTCFRLRLHLLVVQTDVLIYSSFADVNSYTFTFSNHCKACTWFTLAFVPAPSPVCIHIHIT